MPSNQQSIFYKYSYLYQALHQPHRSGCLVRGGKLDRGGDAYSFPVADVTNEHNLGCLEQHKCIVCQSWRPEVQNWYYCAEINNLTLFEDLKSN